MEILEKVARNGEFSAAVDDLVGCLARMKLREAKPVLNYSQLYVSPWSASYDDELRHRYLTYKMKAWAKTTGPNGTK
jgi:hypothetical protein